MNKYIIKAKYTGECKGILELIEKGENTDKKICQTEAYFGRSGVTTNKKEGDGKTPLGEFKLGYILGTHKQEEVSNNPEYIQINQNLYWVDDTNSIFYNKLVDITKVEKDWNSAEHLIEYPTEYEYIVEIKTNPNNIPGKGSAIFLHCSANKPTAGCIAIAKEKMEEVLKKVARNDIIIIEGEENNGARIRTK